MKPWPPAVVAADWLCRPRSWPVALGGLFAGAFLIAGLAWAVLLILVAPIIAMATVFLYGFAVMARNWFEVLLLGMGLGAVVVLGTAMEEGIGFAEAQGLFIGSIVLMLGLRLVHTYLEPLWNTQPD